MRKITMKRKGKSTEKENADNSETQDIDDTQPEEVEQDSNSSRENGTSKRNKNRKSKGETSLVEPEEEHKEPEKRNKKKNKRGRKSKSNNVQESNGTEDDNAEHEEVYEVEQVIDQKSVKGVKYFLIRWKGYGSESDTWEPESTLDCADLVAKFLNSQKSEDSSKKGKKRGSQSNNKSPKKTKVNDDNDDEDEQEIVGEYEVDRILEVHFKKTGKREFLVHWKGYSNNENTWEPEENMSCHSLIEKFMEKVNKARETDTRELRVNRAPTKHFTLSMQQSGRRLSRRNLGKQRAQYQEYE